MNDLVFMVPANEWTVEEFERQMRGFRAKLIAFGDVFVVPQQPVEVANESKGTLLFVKEPSFSTAIVKQVLDMKVHDTIFVENSNPKLTQVRSLTAVSAFRKKTKSALYIRTSMVTKGDKRGVQIKRIA